MRKFKYAQVGHVAMVTKHVLSYESAVLLNTISRLRKKHQRYCEYDCNGQGYVPRGIVKGFMGWMRCDDPRSMVGNDSVFNVVCGKVEDKIKAMVEKMSELESLKMSVDFQHDPRGNTVILKINDTDITDALYL